MTAIFDAKFRRSDAALLGRDLVVGDEVEVALGELQGEVCVVPANTWRCYVSKVWHLEADFSAQFPVRYVSHVTIQFQLPQHGMVHMPSDIRVTVERVTLVKAARW